MLFSLLLDIQVAKMIHLFGASIFSTNNLGFFQVYVSFVFEIKDIQVI